MNKILFRWAVMLGMIGFSSLAAGQVIRPTKMQSLLDSLGKADGVIVLNFWSTWCKPCIDELPHFLEVSKTLKADSVQLWLVSQDTRSLFQSGALKDFVAKKQWDATHFWLDETDADYYCPLIDKTWSGAIPATLILNSRTGYRAFYEASLSKQALQEAIKKAMQ